MNRMKENKSLLSQIDFYQRKGAKNAKQNRVFSRGRQKAKQGNLVSNNSGNEADKTLPLPTYR